MAELVSIKGNSTPNIQKYDNLIIKKRLNK